jgi:hypothetical protein
MRPSRSSQVACDEEGMPTPPKKPTAKRAAKPEVSPAFAASEV